MILQIKKNCLQFHRMKVEIKEAYDFTKEQKRERISYELEENPESLLGNKYQYLYKLLFHLRNSNKMMLNLINYCDKSEYENLSHFIVHFLYENILNSSFVQEDMLVLIYLLLEQYIYQNLNPSSSISSFLDQTFLNQIFKSLTRKEDVRSYLIVLLSEIILQMENITEGVLSVQLYKINDLLKSKNKQKEEQPIVSRHRAVSGLYQNTQFGVKKITSKIVTKVDNEINEEITEENRLNTVAGGECDDDNEKYAKFFKDENSETTSESKPLEESNSKIEEVKQTENMDPLDEYFVINETTLKYLKEKVDYFEKEKNNKENENSSSYASQELKDFMNKQISNISQGENVEEKYSNRILLANLKSSSYANQSEQIKKILVENAKKITDLLKILIKNLLDNITTIPYTIKCICKIIDLLIEQKFEETKIKISSFDKMMYTVAFLLGSLIIPIISNPDYNGIITTNIISSSTKNNLMVLVQILKQIVRGNLFTNESNFEFTIFNTCIIDIMPSIITLINSVRKTKLPSVIEKLIQNKGKQDRDVNYNYLVWNHNENIEHQSICFSWNDAATIVRIIKKHLELFQNEEELKEKDPDSDDEEKEKEKEVELKKAINEIVKNDYEKYFLQLKDNDLGKNAADIKQSSKGEQVEIIKKKIKKYVFFSKINFRKEFKDRLNGKVVHSNINANNAFNFTKTLGRVGQFTAALNLKKSLTRSQPTQKQIETAVTENTEVTKIKECLCEVLKYINIISKENMDVNVSTNAEATESFNNFLLPKIISMIKFESGSCSFLNYKNEPKSKIPLIFYATYLENNLVNLPINYRSNNYALLFSELVKDKEQKLKYAKNEDVINQLFLKIKNSEKLNMIINSNLSQLKQLEKLLNIESFVDKIKIPIVLEYKQEGEQIKSIQIEEVKKVKGKNKDQHICNSIDDFINCFPQLTNIQKDDILDYQENELALDKVIFKYFNMIKAALKSNETFSKYKYDEINSIHDDLTNYIISKIYEKIFPKKRTKKDIKIYKKCQRLNWIKPKNLIKDQKVVNETLWKTAMDYINQMDKEKTPANKIKSFAKAYAILQNSITFCTGKDDLGVDDSIQVLIYVMIKACPKKIWSNFNYARIFIDPELSKKQFGLLLTQMEMIITIIENMKSSDLIDVKESEFGVDEKEEDINVDLDELSK